MADTSVQGCHLTALAAFCPLLRNSQITFLINMPLESEWLHQPVFFLSQLSTLLGSHQRRGRNWANYKFLEPVISPRARRSECPARLSMINDKSRHCQNL